MHQDPDECRQARSTLTIPRKRLSAELAWLLGMTPDAASKVVESLKGSFAGMDRLVYFKYVLGLNNAIPITQSNWLAAGLSRHPDKTPKNLAKWILEIAQAFENIDPEEVRGIINAERAVSGFPKETDLSAVKAEIRERQQHFRKVLTSALHSLSVKERAKMFAVVVKTATNNGAKPGLILIDDLVDSYEEDARQLLEQEERSIQVLDEKLRTEADGKSVDSTLEHMVNQLVLHVKNWDCIAQPIQLSKKSRGLFHETNYLVAGRVRELALHLWNEHGKLDFSRQLTNTLREVFAEVVDVSERLAEDAKVLDEIAEQRDRVIETARKREEEWRREITYEADVGTLFKSKLRISPEGIEWQENRWNLDAITRIRWGGTRHSFNGIPTGTTYSILFGNDSGATSIELKGENVYSNFIDRLWRAVGVRLLTEFLESLRGGRSHRFGSAVFSDEGVELERKRFFSPNERVFCRWNDLEIWNDAGVFCIGKKFDRKIAASFSYLYEDNIHVLEAAIRMLWKRGSNRLSSLLEK